MQVTSSLARLELPDGVVILVEAAGTTRDQDVADRLLSFNGVATAIEAISASIKESLAKARPAVATVEFGVQVAIDSGKLTAVLIKGTASATLKVTLQWSDAA